jgi:hypothetical protein
LDQALNRAAQQGLAEQEAGDFLFAQIQGENYIPPGQQAAYRQALVSAYRKHCNIETEDEGGLVLRIFGSGCVSCQRLYSQLIELLDRLGLAADIEHIYDPDEIGRAGILHTPALMINGKVKSSGLLPRPAQLEQWLREYL